MHVVTNYPDRYFELIRILCFNPNLQPRHDFSVEQATIHVALMHFVGRLKRYFRISYLQRARYFNQVIPMQIPPTGKQATAKRN